MRPTLTTVNTQTPDGGLPCEGTPSRPARLLRWSPKRFPVIGVLSRS
jgi:hypothetical protein